MNVFLWIMVIQALVVCSSSAAEDSALRIKAAFIYRFCGYTTWPQTRFSGGHDPIRVGVVGHQRVVDEINRAFIGKTVGGRPLSVHKVDRKSDVEAFHLLYFSKSSRSDLPDFPVLRQPLPILAITEEPALSENAIINFIMQGDYIRFEISRTRAQEVGLEISSQLLSVAIAVQ